MSSPGDTFHDTSEQTPLLPDNNADEAQPEQAPQRSFLPSIMNWRNLAHGHCKPPKPPPISIPKEPDHEDQHPPSISESSSTGLPNNNEGYGKPNNSNGSDTGAADGPSDDTNDNGESTTAADSAPPTTGPWGDPAGLDMRRANDENVLLFREAIGIPTSSTRPNTPASEMCHSPHHGPNHNDGGDPESGGPSLDQSREHATGIYARIIQEKKAKVWQSTLLNGILNACHVAQILVGAVLTTLGPNAQNHSVAITVLGATNTVLAGVFVLMKGQGLPDRLHKNALAFRRVQDWVEETDALLVAGVVGRDRREVGLLVETAFQRYNAAVANEQSSWPDPTKLPADGATSSGVASREIVTVPTGAGTGTRAVPSTPVPVPVPATSAQNELLVDIGTPGGDGGPGKSPSNVQTASVSSSYKSDNLNQDGGASRTSTTHE
ncbi:hypothetical protein Sste5346_006376 [Sporothrix stenoceras]|uniref:SMODS and SLOG-associating 2TM effector domain-containing protein n=1 Tax=Sporothrix stenoceras TaxID=5173 RepID=A0ABR3Z038_9PEZI